MPFGSAIEGGRLEVGRERDDVAQVLRGLDDVDPLVVGDRRQVVLDQVPARPEHRVAIGLERGLECRRLVRP